MEIKAELIKKSGNPIGNLFTESDLSIEDRKIIQRIKNKTSLLNKNNITRTKAYLDFYTTHPEIHWAFLAHMVSRNGGWNMTDLIGELLSELITEKQIVSIFSFIERGNWLIFQDAYPQLLLYEESIKRKKTMFYLLPSLQISTFMETVWNSFFRNHDRFILTVALIINEQNYIEERVVQKPVFNKEVFESLEFTIQDLFSFTQILFPYSADGNIRLVGQTVRHFASLQERILLGKRLYSLILNHFNGIINWAKLHPHTGSRKDYWPHIFHNVKEGVPKKGYQLRLRSCSLLPETARIYSPELRFVWKDITHNQAEKGDWFHDWRVIDYLTKKDEYVNGDIQHKYCLALEKLELAVLAKKSISKSK